MKTFSLILNHISNNLTTSNKKKVLEKKRDSLESLKDWKIERLKDWKEKVMKKNLLQNKGTKLLKENVVKAHAQMAKKNSFNFWLKKLLTLVNA